MVRTHHEQRGIVDSACEALSQPEEPFEVRKTSSGQSTFVKPWDRRFKQHSLEITCGVPGDRRLCNFSSVTLCSPQSVPPPARSHQLHSCSPVTARQSLQRCGTPVASQGLCCQTQHRQQAVLPQLLPHIPGPAGLIAQPLPTFQLKAEALTHS